MDFLFNVIRITPNGGEFLFIHMIDWATVILNKICGCTLPVNQSSKEHGETILYNKIPEILK
jgi:hypothetical protein